MNEWDIDVLEKVQRRATKLYGSVYKEFKLLW